MKLKNARKNQNSSLKIKNSEIPLPKSKTKGARYTPLSKRADKPNGIYWLVKNFPKYLIQKYAKLLVQQKKRFSP